MRDYKVFMLVSIHDRTPEELESIFLGAESMDWKIRTPSHGRAGKGRKNRGRILPKGRAKRYMQRFTLKCLKRKDTSLYSFLKKQGVI